MTPETNQSNEQNYEWKAPEIPRDSEESRPETDMPVVEKKANFRPTFPSSEISIDTLSEGMRWGECRVPISFDFNASLPSDRGGQAAYDGGRVEISIAAGIPPEFKHIVVYHELIEAEALSNGLPAEESHPMACEMEAQYVAVFLSKEEKAEFESLFGVSNSPAKKEIN